MLSLIKSPIFQNEYTGWKNRINEITNNDELKKELLTLLNELVSQVKFLDNQHLDLVNNNRLTSQSLESKNRISEIRKTIDKRLTDYERKNS